MRITMMIIIALAMMTFAKDVPQHYILENPPLGWTAVNGGIFKGDVKDPNTLAILVQYREFDSTLTEENIRKSIQKAITSQYGKLKDIGPATVAGHATELFEFTDLGGILHHFYFMTEMPGKAWMVEVRGRQTQISAAEAEIGLILGKLKLV